MLIFKNSEFNKPIQDEISSKIQLNGYRATDICSDPDGVLHVEMAVAGFSKDDLEVSIEDGLLIVKGTVSKETLEDDEGMIYTQRQIAKRNFISKFKLDVRYATSEEVLVGTMDGILTISIWPIEEEKPKVRKFIVE